MVAPKSRGLAIISESDYPHVSADDIGGLIEGRFGESDRTRMLAHFRECDRCLDLYYETVNFRALFGSAPVEEKPHAIPNMPRPIVTKPTSAFPFGRWRGKTNRVFAVSASAIVLIVVGYLFGSVDRFSTGQLDASMLAPVRGAVETATMWGPIVLPGGERLIDGKGSVYRSGFVPVDDELETSLKYLYDEYRDGRGSSDVAYWLSAGYLSTGQIDAARDVCAEARETDPDDLRLMLIDGIIAYLDRDVVRSESLLRFALKKHPDDPVVGINLAIVLGNHGDAAEAREILIHVREKHVGTPFAARADTVLARMPNL